ncbi:MAG: serine dehydratase subunit alpha family protein [Tissierellia bacterium]|nr:serine dehydratase subunit alpha family protein [Tissierellia bacterium]
MEDYSKIIKEELIPAFGCTEPIALAFASAKVAEVLGGDPDYLDVKCSGNIIKNTKSVVVPGTDGQRGIKISCTVGAIAGDASKNLEVLSDIDKDKLPVAHELIEKGYCKVSLKPGVENLYIEIDAGRGEDTAKVIIAESHTNIVYIEKNGVVLEEKASEEATKKEDYDYNFDDIYEYASNADLSDVIDILELQIQYNYEIAKEGLSGSYGSEIGKFLHEDRPDDVERDMVAYAAAGSDARMSGSEMPVVINSGSGNQGITVSLPIIVYAKANDLMGEPLYRALAFANLIGLYMKQGIGRLSAYCGAVSAASAAVAGLAFIKGESKEIAAQALVNSLAGNSGLICDGAKASCALKIASSLNNALLGYKQAQSGLSFNAGDGIVMDNVDETIKAVGRIARYGMKTTDEVILNEMIGNRDYIKEM